MVIGRIWRPAAGTRGNWTCLPGCGSSSSPRRSMERRISWRAEQPRRTAASLRRAANPPIRMACSRHLSTPCEPPPYNRFPAPNQSVCAKVVPWRDREWPPPGAGCALLSTRDTLENKERIPSTGATQMGEFQAYPASRYHYSGKITSVQNAEEEKALGGGWARSPTEFAPYQCPRRLGPQYDPVKWVDQWSVEELSENQRKHVKAQLHRAHAAFWKSPDAPNAPTDVMRRAFDGLAHILFDAGLLNEDRLTRDIPQLVWDSAIAGGW